jgi:hypothetical protein
VLAANNILSVRINGTEVASTSANGGGTTSWTEYTYTFNASGATTKVEFAGGGPADSLGTFLDNVSLHPYNCSYQIIGGTCTLWEEKDLETGDYYWHYGDVKPGDYGKNIISLHVLGNDAYACLLVNNTQDNENDLIDPEANAGDTTQGPTGNGELSNFLNAFVWMDSTPDNTYNLGEDILYGPNSPLKDMKNMLPISLTATTTANIGVAWCFGTQDVNEETGVISCSGAGDQDIAQTDSFLASLTAYAEQQRNNEAFDCAKVVLPTQ